MFPVERAGEIFVPSHPPTNIFLGSILMIVKSPHVPVVNKNKCFRLLTMCMRAQTSVSTSPLNLNVKSIFIGPLLRMHQ